MSPLIYKVYARAHGAKKKEMIAGFSSLTDAVNYAYQQSVGLYLHPPEGGIVETTLLVTDGGKKIRAYRGGEGV